MKFVNYSAKQARWKCQRNMLWNEWKYSSKKTLNLSHLFFFPLSAELMLQLSPSVCSRAGVSGEANSWGAFCNLSGTREQGCGNRRWREGGFLVPSVARGHVGRDSPAMGSPTLILASDLLPNDISCVEKQSCSAFCGSEHQLPGGIEHPRGPHSHNKQG